jgi:ABC-2 type transport system permease protein
MNKTWLIIKREYLTRVRNKTFILSTFLTPLAFAGMIAAVITITIKNHDRETVAVVDDSGMFKTERDSSQSLIFVPDPKADTADLDTKGYSAIVYAPHTGPNKTNKWKIFSRKTVGLMENEEVEEKIRNEWENHALTKMGVNISGVDSVKRAADLIAVDPVILEAGGEKSSSSGLAYGIGYGAGFLIYITLFIYGSMVMRGVMEEKTNRIAEVIVSSVKPFQLMMGKIIGIGAVGLTQFFLWIILIAIFSSAITFILPANVMAEVQSASSQMPGQSAQTSQAMEGIAGFWNNISSVNWLAIISCFVFYFIFGYLFYASLFAAVGSTVNEDPQDVQSLMLPITMPIVLAIVIMMNAIIRPEGNLAVISSMIPFFSPVVMIARIPFGIPGTVPYWQLALSMIILVAGFIFNTWLSAKIYRTGILLYGKKVTFKEMWKWLLR